MWRSYRNKQRATHSSTGVMCSPQEIKTTSSTSHQQGLKTETCSSWTQNPITELKEQRGCGRTVLPWAPHAGEGQNPAHFTGCCKDKSPVHHSSAFTGIRPCYSSSRDGTGLELCVKSSFASCNNQHKDASKLKIYAHVCHSSCGLLKRSDR